MATKKIYLFCEAGMSTSIMVNKMMEVVKKHQMPLEIHAFPAIHAEEKVEQEKPVAILLGPQVRHIQRKVSKIVGDAAPIAVIDAVAYGRCDGAAVLKQAEALVEGK